MRFIDNNKDISLNESSLAALKHIIENYNIATISAFRKSNTYDENKYLSNQLYETLISLNYDNDIKGNPYGVYRLVGGYPEILAEEDFYDEENDIYLDSIVLYGTTYYYNDLIEARNNNEEIIVDVIEDSYLVINFDLDFDSFKEDMCLLCGEYNQDSVLIKDIDGICKLFDSDFNIVAKIGKNLDYAITEYWSQLVDCSDSHKIKWSINEQVIHKRKNKFNSINELILFDYVKNNGEHSAFWTGDDSTIKNGNKIIFENKNMYRIYKHLYMSFNDIDWYRLKV